jgi:hypothetical protein
VRDGAQCMEALQGAGVVLETAQCKRMREILDFMVQSAWEPYSAQAYLYSLVMPKFGLENSPNANQASVQLM